MFQFVSSELSKDDTPVSLTFGDKEVMLKDMPEYTMLNLSVNKPLMTSYIVKVYIKINSSVHTDYMLFSASQLYDLINNNDFVKLLPLEFIEVKSYQEQHYVSLNKTDVTRLKQMSVQHRNQVLTLKSHLGTSVKDTITLLSLESQPVT